MHTISSIQPPIINRKWPVSDDDDDDDDDFPVATCDQYAPASSTEPVRTSRLKGTSRFNASARDQLQPVNFGPALASHQKPE